MDTNESGAMVETVDYFPFGEVRLDDNAPAYDNNYKYTGKELDAETGLSYYESRYYNAKTGKFVSLDSWEGDLNDPQSLNKYSYVKNNPLKYVDVTGEQAFDPALFLVQSTANLTINAVTGVVPHTAEYVSEFGQAAYYGASAIGSKMANDQAGYSSNMSAFQYHTNEKMVPAAQKSLSDNLVLAGGLITASEAGAFSKSAVDPLKDFPLVKKGSAGGEGSGKRYVSDYIKDLELKRTDGKCVFCGIKTVKEPGPTKLNMDHSISVKDGGNNSWSNLQTTCRSCNLEKGAKSSLEYVKQLLKK